MIRDYYELTKPGIIRGNLITACAGFFLAAQGTVNLSLLAATLLGISLIIGSACVFNNYIDRDIDRLMERTKKRALVSGAVPPINALIFASTIGLLGISVLGIFTNSLTVYLGVLGFVAYVVLYGYFKRHSVHGTLIGTISGAIPPVAGYTAVSNQIDAAAIILFVILVFWQMPHFYAIAMYRRKDYANAGIPVLPVKKGNHITKIAIMFYILGFTGASTMLTILGYTGYGYLAVVLLIGIYWFVIGAVNFSSLSDKLWGRKMFLVSLIVITLMSLAIAIDSFLTI